MDIVLTVIKSQGSTLSPNYLTYGRLGWISSAAWCWEVWKYHALKIISRVANHVPVCRWNRIFYLWSLTVSSLYLTLIISCISFNFLIKRHNSLYLWCPCLSVCSCLSVKISLYLSYYWKSLVSGIAIE